MLEGEFGELLQRTRRVQAEWRRLDSQNADIRTRLQAVAADSEGLDPDQKTSLVDGVDAIPNYNDRAYDLKYFAPALKNFDVALQSRIVRIATNLPHVMNRSASIKSLALLIPEITPDCILM
jgi:hypothetical protein